MTFTRSKIDFKDDTRKSKLISRRSNFPSEKGEKMKTNFQNSLWKRASLFQKCIPRSRSRANSTSYIISNFFSHDFFAESSFKRGGRGWKQPKKKKAVAESGVKFALSVENFQCSPQGRKFNLRNRVGFQTKFQTFQRVSTFSVFTKPPPPAIFPSYITLTIFNIPPRRFFHPFSYFSTHFPSPSFDASSHFMHTGAFHRERRLDCLHLLDVLTKLPVSCRSLYSTCSQRGILPTRVVVDTIFWVSRWLD